MTVVRLLGPVDVTDATGEVRAPGSPIRATLLALLGLEAGSPVESERLLDLAWDAKPPTSGLRALRFHISRLRAELGVDGLILTVGSAYRLDATSDLDAVEAARARTHLSPLEGAVLLEHWRGEALSGTRPCATLEHEQARLAELKLELIDRRGRALLAAGEAATVVSDFSRLCLDHPLREGLWATLIAAHYQTGNQAAALRCYDHLRTALLETSGIDPSPELRQLYDDVLHQHERLRPRQAPFGVVTILVTDVEESMALWAGDADAMAASIRHHHEIIHSVMQEHEGHIVTRAEDSFYVAFQAVSDGIAAAISAQSRLDDTVWPGPTLGVRVGLHLGETEGRDGNVFGPVVNTAAQVAAAAHGGQVVCTEAVRLAADIPARDLGMHRLNDVSLPLQLWQVGDGLFPTLRTLAGRSNLPTPPTRLFGRAGDVASVQRLLATGRLVTLTAVGGAGKSRLAIAVCEAERSEWPHGIWFVDLTSVPENQEVAPLVASTLGLELQPGDVVVQLSQHLARRPQLVVLDNCEHVIDGCAELASSILLAGGGSKLLATSREWLDVDGEQVYQVPPLGLTTDDDGNESAAALLFADRARAVDSSFRSTADNRSAVEEVCRRLDGLPLAIELAAARSAVWSPAQLAARLDDRFRLLSGGRRRQRGRTLESTIEWSFDLLEPAERRAFTCLGVFLGGFDLRSAAAVMETSLADTSDLIESLVTKSMVVTNSTEPRRFRLLETLKAYAENRLVQAQEAEAARDRHALHFLERAAPQSMITASDLRRVVELEPDYANLEAAASWLLAATRWTELTCLIHAHVTTWLPDSAIAGRLDLVERCRSNVDDPHSHALLDICEIRCSVVGGDWVRLARVVERLELSVDPEGESMGHFYRAMLHSRTNPAEASRAMSRYEASAPGPLRQRARVVAIAGTLMTAMQRNDAETVRLLATDVANKFEDLDFLPYQWAAARSSIGVISWVDGDVEAPIRAAIAISDRLAAKNTRAFEETIDFFRIVSLIGTGPPASAADAVRSHCLDLISGRHLSVDSSGLALLAELSRSEGDQQTAQTLMRSWTLTRAPDIGFFGRQITRLLGIDAEVDGRFSAHRREPGWINDRPKHAIEEELRRRGWLEIG